MTPLIIDIRDIARQDIAERYIWLAREAGIDVADRMAVKIDGGIFRLAELPGIGSPIKSVDPGLTGLKKWRVPDFPDLLIFYRVVGNRLDVIRLLHAAQDWVGQLSVV